jgi:hypothetical protein
LVERAATGFSNREHAIPLLLPLGPVAKLDKSSLQHLAPAGSIHLAVTAGSQKQAALR